MRRASAALFAALLLALTAVPAAGQAAESSLFVTGPIEWSPSIQLRDLGYDSNIFMEQKGREKADIIGVLAPQVTANIDAPRFRLNAATTQDLVYYERYADQRSHNQRYTGQVEVPLGILLPYLTGGWQRGRERPTSAIDLRTLLRQRSVGAGLTVLAFAKAALTVSARREEIEYGAGQQFRGVDIATRLNRTQESASAVLRFAVTPLTALLLDAGVMREEYPTAIEKNQESRRAALAIDIAPDAVIRGRATVGYHRLDVQGDPLAVPFASFTTDIDLGYSLLEMTRFGIRYSRDTSASLEEPYYVDNVYALDVQQRLIGPVDLILRASHQEQEYPGLPSRRIEAHLDTVDRLSGGLQIRLSDTASIGGTYELSRRDSTDPTLRYDRRRMFTSILLGF